MDILRTHEASLYNAVISLAGIQTQVNYYGSGGSERYRSTTNVGRWQLDLSLSKLDLRQSKELFSFLCLHGRAEPFLVRIKELESRYQASEGVINVLDNVDTGKIITANNLPVSQIIASAGDFISFANHYKVYQLAQPVISDNAGVAVLNLSTPLAKPVNSTEIINFKKIYFKVALLEDLISLDLDTYLMSGWTLKLEEVWR